MTCLIGPQQSSDYIFSPLAVRTIPNLLFFENGDLTPFDTWLLPAHFANKSWRHK